MKRRSFVGRRRWERGGAAALVAVLLGGGVLLGVSALTLDVGSIWWERRQLQNAADSASLALAGECARGSAACTPTSATVTGYGALNTKDGTVSNDGVCVRLTSGLAASWGTKACTTDLDVTPAQRTAKAGNLKECLPLPTWLRNAPTVNYVEVKIGTSTSGTSAGPLPSIFSRAITGQDNPHVTSCARAAWGPVGGATTLPLTFAKCEWEEATTPPKGGYGSAYETALPLKYSKKATACTATAPSGGDFDGGFGWLTSAIGCRADVDANSWVDAQTGVGGGSGCYNEFAPGKTIFIPIYDCISDSKTLCVPGSPSGTHTWYHIDGFASFYVTGVDITGAATFLPGYPSVAAKNECNQDSKDNKCLYGYFLQKYIPAAEFILPGGTNYGSPGVVPAG